MSSTPLPAPLLALIPHFSTRFAQIMSYLVAGIRGFQKPEHATIWMPLTWRLNRLAGRLQRLLALLAAGRRPRQWPPRPDRAPRERPAQVLPTKKAWLFREWGTPAAAFRQHLYDLLMEPGLPDLLAAEPALGRILRPLCHTLGLPKPGERKPDPKPPKRPVTPPPPPPPAPSYPPPMTVTEFWSREWIRLKAR